LTNQFGGCISSNQKINAQLGVLEETDREDILYLFIIKRNMRTVPKIFNEVKKKMESTRKERARRIALHF